MKKLFTFVCLLLLGFGNVLQAQEEQEEKKGKDYLYFTMVFGESKEKIINIRFCANPGDKFSIGLPLIADTIEVTSDGITERTYVVGDADQFDMVLNALDTTSHVTDLVVVGSAYANILLEHCPALRKLSISNTSIKNLFINAYPSLQSVKSINNPLLNLFAVHDCPALQMVECSGNHSLKVFGLEANYGLEEIVCTYNDSLERLEPSRAPNLKMVDCSHNNQLKFLILSKQSALKTVKCTDNPLLERLELIDCYSLNSLDIFKLPKLAYLLITNTKLTSLDVSEVPVLKTLYCGNNKLTSLSFSPGVILERLVCSNNSLTLLNLADLVKKSLDVDIIPQLIPVLRQVGQALDLRSEMNINGKATQWYILDADGNIITNNTNWGVYHNGNFSFRKKGKYRIELQHALPNYNGDLCPAEVFYDVTVVDSVARPVFSEPSGVIKRHTLVSLSTTTPDARIFYTTDGSVPDSAALLYTAPIRIDEAVKIRAIAIQDSLTSRVATASYRIDVTDNESDRFTEQIRVYAKDRNIILSEPVGEVEVFTANGQCVYKGLATAIPVKRSGLYVVVANGGRWKVAVR